MKKSIFVVLSIGLISLSGFNIESANYEQIAFDYFVSDILRNDFKDISTIEFKGNTETTYSGLGDYKFCLKPEEKLQSLIKGATEGLTRNLKQIKYEQIKSVTITDFKNTPNIPDLHLYPSVRVADKFYVFLSLRKENEPLANYVFELNPDGNISRSCRMN